ncbi:hypothetical protein [Actinoplanes xinjiangensis]
MRTVQRYAAASLDDLLAPAIHRSSVLDDYATTSTSAAPKD